MAEITCLQVGNVNWAEKYSIPEQVEWLFLDNQVANDIIINQKKQSSSKKSQIKYNVLLLTQADQLTSYRELIDMMDYYQILYDPSQVQADKTLQLTLEKKLSQPVNLQNPGKIIEDIGMYFYKGQYGHRLSPQHLTISSRLPGTYWRNGKHQFVFEGEYGQEWLSLVSYRETLHGLIDTKKKVRLFLEYEKTDSIQIKLVINRFNIYSGAVGTQEIFNEEQLRESVEYGPCEDGEVINYNLFIKGTGKITIGNIQIRYSRGKYGEFTLGGKRYVDDYGHELISYFNPADFQPPLCVYFGGYRTAGGFEGYQMMKNMGCPFLLFEDSNAEGGGFYRGSEMFEQQVVQQIQAALDFLGFTNKELVLSGLSMGTHAAMYYGTFLAPNSVIVCKPIANFQTIIDNSQLKGVGVFPTSFDVTKLIMKHKGFQSVSEIDQEFWRKFQESQLKDTQFYVTYMKNEEYDDQAFEQLIEYNMNNQRIIYAKGIPGRHNDYQDLSLSSYLYHYDQLLKKQFNRQEQK